MRDAILHLNLLLVRCPDSAELDAILARAHVRRALVHRLSPEEALFDRTALKDVLARLEQTQTAVVYEELPASPSASGQKARS